MPEQMLLSDSEIVTECDNNKVTVTIIVSVQNAVVSVKVMIADPTATPVTIPLGVMEAMRGFELDHIPFVVADKVTDEPIHNRFCPESSRRRT